MTKIKSEYQQLVHKLDSFGEGKRCGEEFIKLCQQLPNVVKCEANFIVLMHYFLPDSLLFDHLSGIEAIHNDESLRKRLACRSDKQVEADRQEAIGEHNEALLAKPISELQAELQQKDKERRESRKKRPPATLTREAFRKASPAQTREWADKWGLSVLNDHWAQLEATNA